jgi:hypothetical protein
LPDTDTVDDSRAVWDQVLGAWFIAVPEVVSSADLAAIVRAAESVHEQTSGRVSPRAFLLTRHAALRGRTPMESLDDTASIRVAAQNVIAECR